MPDVSLYYVQTGYIEPGYFVSEPAPPELIKKEQITIYEIFDIDEIFRINDETTILKSDDHDIIYRPINRTTAYVRVTEV
jgi:hypothetical protein